MFLDEIEKDEIGYAEYCKNKVKEYFVNFFDKKYEKQIERRMDDTPLIFVEAKYQPHLANIGIYKLKNEMKTLLSHTNQPRDII